MFSSGKFTLSSGIIVIPVFVEVSVQITKRSFLSNIFFGIYTNEYKSKEKMVLIHCKTRIYNEL